MTQSNEKSFETYVEEILLTQGRLERRNKRGIGQRTVLALITAAVTGKVDVRGMKR
jgi:hypothetical protein